MSIRNLIGKILTAEEVLRTIANPETPASTFRVMLDHLCEMDPTTLPIQQVWPLLSDARCHIAENAESAARLFVKLDAHGAYLVPRRTRSSVFWRCVDLTDAVIGVLNELPRDSHTLHAALYDLRERLVFEFAQDPQSAESGLSMVQRLRLGNETETRKWLLDTFYPLPLNATLDAAIAASEVTAFSRLAGSPSCYREDRAVRFMEAGLEQRLAGNAALSEDVLWWVYARVAKAEGVAAAAALLAGWPEIVQFIVQTRDRDALGALGNDLSTVPPEFRVQVATLVAERVIATPLPQDADVIKGMAMVPTDDFAWLVEVAQLQRRDINESLAQIRPFVPRPVLEILLASPNANVRRRLAAGPRLADADTLKEVVLPRLMADAAVAVRRTAASAASAIGFSSRGQRLQAIRNATPAVLRSILLDTKKALTPTEQASILDRIAASRDSALDLYQCLSRRRDLTCESAMILIAQADEACGYNVVENLVATDDGRSLAVIEAARSKHGLSSSVAIALPPRPEYTPEERSAMFLRHPSHRVRRRLAALGHGLTDEQILALLFDARPEVRQALVSAPGWADVQARILNAGLRRDGRAEGCADSGE
jgi:hypothetical protein